MWGGALEFVLPSFVYHNCSERDYGCRCLEGGGWSPCFTRLFNDWELKEVERFFNFLVSKKVLPRMDDRLSMKEAKDGSFTVKFMYKLLSGSRDATFPFKSIWNPCVTTKVGFFVWESKWGMILTLDQLKRRGRVLANRCFLYNEDEETVDHLFVHCPETRML